MLGPQRLFPDGESAIQERLGFGVAPLGVVEPRQIAEAPGGVGVLGPQRLFEDGEGTLIELGS